MDQEKPRKEDRPDSGGLKVIGAAETAPAPIETATETETVTEEDTGDAGQS